MRFRAKYAIIKPSSHPILEENAATCIIVEILFFITGLVSLIGGKLTLSKNYPLEGRRARITGLILALSLPLAFDLDILYGTLVGTGELPRSSEPYVACIDIGVIIACAAGVFGYAHATRTQVPSVSPMPPQPPTFPPMN